MMIRIKNLRLRTVIGIFDWERKTRQEVIVNVTLEFDGSKAAQSDRIEDSVDYKSLTKRIIAEVEQSSFQLIEALANHVLGLVMSDERVRRAEIEIDKPGALRFAESVSVSCSAERSG